MKKSTIIGIAIVVVAVIGLGVFALGGKETNSKNMSSNSSENKNSTNAPEQAMVAPNTVIMDNLDFQQKVIKIKKGETVTWKNQDTAKHNVIFDDPSVGSVEGDKLIQNGEELKFTFNKVGEFSYSCTPHPFMKAKIVVTE